MYTQKGDDLFWPLGLLLEILELSGMTTWVAFLT